MKLHDLRDLDWSTTRAGGVSYGCYYKASRVENGKKFYYKCSNFYSQINAFGDESINEVICSRFLRKLGFDCLKYTLVRALVRINGLELETYVCKSENHFRGYDSRTTLEKLKNTKPSYTVDGIINCLGIQDSIRRMIIADFLVLQRDRHGDNIELLLKGNNYSLAPLFDNGLGLLAPYPSCYNMDISNFDVLYDYPVNNYIGTKSLYTNLNFVSPIRINKLTKEDKSSIFRGMQECLPILYRNKIWELLVYRYMFLRKRGIIVDD